MNYYQNKTIWITGASSGIGLAIVKELDLNNVNLVLSARNQEKLQEVAGNLRHAKSLVLPLDLADSSNFDALTKRVIQEFGKIDILINNGGISQRSTVSETTEEVDRQIMEVNYFGNIALSKAVLPYFKEQKSGQFAIMSSIAGKFGFFLRSGYSASKHALHGYYESLRLEEEKNGIGVSIICPGKINTPISENAMKGDGSKHNVVDKNQATGMDAGACAKAILKGLSKSKHEILVGGSETKSVFMKRIFPSWFHKILRKKSAT